MTFFQVSLTISQDSTNYLKNLEDFLGEGSYYPGCQDHQEVFSQPLSELAAEADESATEVLTQSIARLAPGVATSAHVSLAVTRISGLGARTLAALKNYLYLSSEWLA